LLIIGVDNREELIDETAVLDNNGDGNDGDNNDDDDDVDSRDGKDCAVTGNKSFFFSSVVIKGIKLLVVAGKEILLIDLF
jgi:hypothetical protein